MSYFTMPDAVALASVVGGVVAIAWRFKPSNNGNGKSNGKDKENGKSNGNGKVTTHDIERLEREIKGKQDVTMCLQLSQTLKDKHDDLKGWTADISTNQQKANETLAQLNTNVAVLVESVNNLAERRKIERDN